MADLFSNIYNPDVLLCLANLSNDEVFTSPVIANQMLDLLPQEIFEDSNTTFLDPCCKSGVFLREIAKRLIIGLEERIPNLQERLDHIYHKQLFGIAITELTSLLSRRSLYCSKYASSKYSVSHFDNIDGNIRFKRIEHTWGGNKCIYCGASKKIQDRGDSKETHAYEFIHKLNLKDLNNMKFDVIIGNPPYQLADGGNGSSAKPIYQFFVKQAKKLNPKYLTMIIPARWYAGGKGLESFRQEMLNDEHITYLKDYVNAKDCFPSNSVGGGVCYFLREREKTGMCNYVSVKNDTEKLSVRKLNEFPIFVRYNEALPIIHKILEKESIFISSIILSRNPFGITSNVRGEKVKNNKHCVKLIASTEITYITSNEVLQNKECEKSYKVMISKVTSEHAGEPDKNGQFKVLSSLRVLEPYEVCTDSYLIIGKFKTKEEAKNLKNYLASSFARFLLLQAVSSINLSKDKFQFVPLIDCTVSLSQEDLYKKYNLTKEEIAFIESMIKPMNLTGEDNE